MSKLRPGRQDYNATFLDTLDRLNPAQKSAVDQIEGPVLVVAGPGTGKTHILAARIGKILLETDAQPNNILCLTTQLSANVTYVLDFYASILNNKNNIKQ